MYGVEAQESVLDQSIDFRSAFKDGNIVLEFIRLGREQERLVVSLPPSEALQAVGAFHRDVLLEIFRLCPEVQDENQLLLRIPDAFALSFLARAGKIGPDAI